MDATERQSRMDHFNAGAAGGEHESSWEAEGRSRIRSLYGSKDIHAVFPEGSAPKAVVPWPTASRLKGDAPANKDPRVHHELAQSRTVMVDPRILSATQPQITHGGLAHYMGEGGRHYDEGGPTYADQHDPGNHFPIVRTRKSRSPNQPTYVHEMLSGHHRALRATLMGQQFEARWVEPED